MTTILLYTNSNVLERGFLSVFSDQGSIDARAVRGTISNVVQAVAANAPGVLLFDFPADEHFPGLAELRRRAPECPIVLWSDTISVETSYQAMKLGVRGI